MTASIMEILSKVDNSKEEETYPRYHLIEASTDRYNGFCATDKYLSLVKHTTAEKDWINKSRKMLMDDFLANSSIQMFASADEIAEHLSYRILMQDNTVYKNSFCIAKISYSAEALDSLQDKERAIDIVMWGHINGNMPKNLTELSEELKIIKEKG